MRTNLILAIFLVFWSTCLLAAEKPMHIYNVTNNKSLKYENKQVNLGKTAYSLFDDIYINYPQLLPNELPEVGINKINERLRYYCLQWINTDSFKFEFLPFAYQALSQILEVSGKSIYNQRNLETSSPRMKEIKPQILFWSGDVLAYQVMYVFNFEFEDQVRVREIAYIKTFYFNLYNGSILKPFDFFASAKVPALKASINLLLEQLYQKQGAKLSSFDWSRYAENNFNENNHWYSEDDNTGKMFEAKKFIGLAEADFRKMYFRLTPFYAEFILTPFSCLNKAYKQIGICIQMPITQFYSFLSQPNTLGILNKIPVSSLEGIRMRNLNPPSYLSFISPLENSEISRFAKGKSEQIAFRKEFNGKDTIMSVIRTVFFNDLGKPTLLVFGNPKNGDSLKYIYDINAQPLREVRYEQGQFSEETRYVYSGKGNLTELFHYSDDGYGEIKQYHYLDTLVYESRKLDFYADFEDLLSPTLVYAFNKNRQVITSYELNKTPDFKNHYQNNHLMGYFRIHYPNLDNAIYAYDSAGMLQTIIADNGRHIHYFTYQNDLLISYSHYESLRLKAKKNYFYDGAGVLIYYEEQDEYSNNFNKYFFKSTY